MNICTENKFYDWPIWIYLYENYTDDLVNKFGLEYLQRELVKKSPTSKIKNNDPNRIIRAYNILTQTGKTIEEWQSDTKPNIDNISYNYCLYTVFKKWMESRKKIA